ncbi:MAG TPA: glycosyltransferase family 39 protein, partial [Acidobacteriota bacterium]|nr:glycosyltransferase family 39 protein [Acidobacteriota bacterium]
MKPSRATFLLLFLFAVMTAVSWLTWANPIVDGGREMNTPLRLLHGDMLYSEVYYLYGPVAPYVNALLFSVFGIHLNTLYAAGIAGSLMLVMLVFYLGRRFMTTWEAMLAAAAVLFLSVFKQSGNLIFPYSYSALYGTVAGVLALIMQLRYLHTKKVSSLIAAGLFSGLALCCKTEFGLAAVASLLTLVILSPRERWRVFLIAFGSFALLPFLIYGTVLAMIPAESLIADTFILPGTIPPELLYFNKLKMGLFDVGRTVRELLSAIALLAGVAGAISLVGRRRAGEPITLCGADRRLRAIWMITFCGWGFLLLQLPLFGTEWDLNPVRAFPVLFIWLIIVIACRSTRLRTMTFSDGALLLIAVYSLAVLARVILRTPAGGAYGSVLIPVPIVLFFIMAVSLLP